MLVAIMGLIGSGKSTISAKIAEHYNALLFDMDIEFPEEYRDRHRSGEIVPIEDVKSYQKILIDKVLTLQRDKLVVLAGFFLDKELPNYIEEQIEVLWINLVTEDMQILEKRILNRGVHFAGLSILYDNWPNRSQQLIGKKYIDCTQSIDGVVTDCVNVIDSFISQK